MDLKRIIKWAFAALIVVLVNLALFLWYWILTDQGNYIEKEVPEASRLIIAEACRRIFITQYYIWFTCINLIMSGIILWYKGQVSGIYFLGLAFAFTFISSEIFKSSIAKNYYDIFCHQRVSRDFMEEPILSAGYPIGPYITPHLKEKDFKGRRAAISGMGKIQYTPAIPALASILDDSSETKVFRGEAYLSLKKMNSDPAKVVLEEFTQELIAQKDTAMYNYIRNYEKGDMY